MLKQVSIRIDDALMKQVKKICIDKGITVQDAATALFEKWVEENKGKQ